METGTVRLRIRTAFRRFASHLAHPHLPPGSPTSSALATPGEVRLDRRLMGWVSAAELTYTRYDDDLASSIEPRPERQNRGLVECITGITEEEGFRVKVTKPSVLLATFALIDWDSADRW